MEAIWAQTHFYQCSWPSLGQRRPLLEETRVSLGLSPLAGVWPWGQWGISSLSASWCLQGATPHLCLRNRTLHSHLINTAFRRPSNIFSPAPSTQTPSPSATRHPRCFQNHDLSESLSGVSLQSVSAKPWSPWSLIPVTTPHPKLANQNLSWELQNLTEPSLQVSGTEPSKGRTGWTAALALRLPGLDYQSSFCSRTCVCKVPLSLIVMWSFSELITPFAKDFTYGILFQKLLLYPYPTDEEAGAQKFCMIPLSK